MKKMGILTFHNTTNYGALLQAFALEKKIEELHGNCEVINYHCKSIEKREFYSFPQFTFRINVYVKNVLKYFKLSKKRRVIKMFQKKYLDISKKEYNIRSIASANDEYDKFIVGSDMVFELGITGGDFTYYLDFADIQKKYSYAASLGVDSIDRKYLNYAIENLNKFQELSVREMQAQKYFSKILNNSVHTDVDPTLLYDGSFWQKYEEKPKKIPKKDYILLYFLDKDGVILNAARKIADEKGYAIISMSKIKEKNIDCEVVNGVTVGEFLYYIHHAKLVITASFHGMIFSINYNTNFMYFNKQKSSSRLENIAIITDTQDRKLSIDNIPKIDCDFEKINEAVEMIRNKSIDYLKKLIDK